MFEFILGVIFVYIVICVLFNALAPNRGGCLSYFFMGWLFGRGNRRRPPRGPRPPMGGGGGGRSFGGGGSFGGGSSRGGGGGRSF